jgi:hypothetical protein
VARVSPRLSLRVRLGRRGCRRGRAAVQWLGGRCGPTPGETAGRPEKGVAQGGSAGARGGVGVADRFWK